MPKRKRDDAIVVCVSDDLKADAKLFAEGRSYAFDSDFSGVDDGGVAILYTHGVAYEKAKVASNEIEWKDIHIGASDAGRTIKGDLKLKAKNVTLIIHACFSAGTVENAPTKLNATDTFAGQLCSALKSLSGIQVVGYQGECKAGRAGFKVGSGAETRRLTRRDSDPQAGSKFEVRYKIGQSGVVVAENGSFVKWG